MARSKPAEGYDPRAFDAAYALIDVVLEEHDRMRGRVGKRMGSYLARMTRRQRRIFARQAIDTANASWNTKLAPYRAIISNIANRLGGR